MAKAEHEFCNSRRVDSPSPKISSNPISPQGGPYDEAYVTLQSIGKGAFGFVKLARRRKDGREVSGRQHSGRQHAHWLVHAVSGEVFISPVCILAQTLMTTVFVGVEILRENLSMSLFKLLHP